MKTMEELVDMIAADESPAQITDKIKDIIFSKASERVDSIRPNTANSLFDSEESVEDSNEEE